MFIGFKSNDCFAVECGHEQARRRWHPVDLSQAGAVCLVRPSSGMVYAPERLQPRHLLRHGALAGTLAIDAATLPPRISTENFENANSRSRSWRRSGPAMAWLRTRLLDAKSNLARASDPHRSTFKRKTYGLAVRGKSRITYHGNRPTGNHPRPWLARSNPARELANLLARGSTIGRIAPGHYFRGGQLLVGFLRSLRAVIRILEISDQQRAGLRMMP